MCISLLWSLSFVFLFSKPLGPEGGILTCRWNTARRLRGRCQRPAGRPQDQESLHRRLRKRLHMGVFCRDPFLGCRISIINSTPKPACQNRRPSPKHLAKSGLNSRILHGTVSQAVRDSRSLWPQSRSLVRSVGLLLLKVRKYGCVICMWDMVKSGFQSGCR